VTTRALFHARAHRQGGCLSGRVAARRFATYGAWYGPYRTRGYRLSDLPIMYGMMVGMEEKPQHRFPVKSDLVGVFRGGGCRPVAGSFLTFHGYVTSSHEIRASVVANCRLRHERGREHGWMSGLTDTLSSATWEATHGWAMIARVESSKGCLRFARAHPGDPAGQASIQMAHYALSMPNRTGGMDVEDVVGTDRFRQDMSNYLTPVPFQTPHAADFRAAGKESRGGASQLALQTTT